jgi:hypothetical protein
MSRRLHAFAIQKNRAERVNVHSNRPGADDADRTRSVAMDRDQASAVIVIAGILAWMLLGALGLRP